MADKITQLLGMIQQNPENPLFHYTLGAEYLKTGAAEKAIAPLREALRLQADYSAAYRELGKALMQTGESEEARQIFRKGIEVANQRGDIQTAKEMQVFMKRIPEK